MTKPMPNPRPLTHRTRPASLLLILGLLALGMPAAGCRSTPSEGAGDGDRPAGPGDGADDPEPTAAAPAPVTAEPVRPSAEPPPGGEGYQFMRPDEMSDDAAVRSAIEALRKAGHAKTVLEKLTPQRAKAVPALRNALRHPDSNVRIQAAMVLARLAEPSKETTDAFVASLLGDPNQEVRAAVARELTEYTDQGLQEPLRRSSPPILYGMTRAHAAWALGAQGDKEAADALVAALDDDETWVRLRSLTALKRLKAHKALPAVVERVKDANPVVRERAIETLQKLTGKKYGEDYAKWKKVVK